MKKLLSALLVFSLLSLSGCASWWATNHGGGLHRENPLLMKTDMSGTALRIVNKAYDIGVPLIDHHLHVIGNGQDLADFCPSMNLSDVPPGEKLESWVNEDRFDFNSSPRLWLKTRTLWDAMGIDQGNEETADQQSLCRLEKLVRGLTATPGERSYGTICATGDAVTRASNEPFRNKKYDVRVHLLAFDGHYDKKGIEVIREKTDVYISNWYVIKLAECLNSKFSDSNPFVPVVSINPYRVDALRQIESLKHRSRYIKWAPTAMGFDPSDSYNNAYFRRVKKYGQVIMSHTGRSDTFRPMDPDFQRFGDPLLMTRALDFGIPVILAHAGGEDVKHYPGPVDEWNWGLETYKKTYHNNENFIEMMASKKNEFEWCLFGDLSALTMEDNLQHFNAFFGPDKKHFNYRMVYGSDYPLVAARENYPVEEMIKGNLIDSNLQLPLEEIFTYNPLAFDVAVKRLLTAPVEGVDPEGSEHLPVEMFMSIEENIRREHNNPGRIHYQRQQCRKWYQTHVGQLG